MLQYMGCLSTSQEVRKCIGYRCHSEIARVDSALLDIKLLNNHQERKYYFSNKGSRGKILCICLSNQKPAGLRLDFNKLELNIYIIKCHHLCLTEFTELLNC